MASVKARINPLSSNEYEIEWDKDSTLQDYFDKVIEKFPSRIDAEPYFKIFIDGYEIDKDYWKYTKPKESVNVLIAIVPKGGQSGQIFKQIAILTIVVATAQLTGGLSLYYAVPIIVSATVGATLLFNALIPPLDNSQAAGFGAVNSYEGSQMFTIGGQSNSTKKHGIVPKVYGEFRMYPNVAVNPYTEIETDPITGELVQYFYAVYDFGLGPLRVRDVRIGETEIENYRDVAYNIVDLNKPSVSEGEWDNESISSFELYKGDVTQISIGVVLNKNSNDIGVLLEEYRAIRNATDNQMETAQEIVATIAFPNGLVSFLSNGDTAERHVDVALEFAEIGTEDWHNFDDINFVDNFQRSDKSKSNVYMPTHSWDDSLTDAIVLINIERYDPYRNQEDLDEDFLAPSSYSQSCPAPSLCFTLPNFNDNLVFEKYNYGVSSTKTTRLVFVEEYQIGTEVLLDGISIGTVTGHSVHPNGTWHNITQSKITRTLFWDIKRTDNNLATEEFYYRDFKGLGTGLPFNTLESTGQSRFTSRDNGNGINRYTGNQQTPLYGTFRFTPKSKKSLKLRMTRHRSFGGSAFRIADAMQWVTLTTRFDVNPIITPLRHSFIELRIKATDQLSGSIKNLSAVCTSVLDVYDDVSETWSKQVSSNPAWIFADILTGEVNKAAINKNRLDLPSIKAWADFADETPVLPPNISVYQFKRFECNFILDYASTVKQVLEQVTSSGQASLNIIDSKYGVLIDREVTIPIQVFTGRNSSNFTSVKKFTTMPDGLKIRYINPGSNWEVKDQIVLNDGQTVGTATNFENIEVFGITNWEQAWRYGRYMLAQAILRQETITINVDFEYLVCTRGDYVLITSDVMKVGGTPARVKTVVGSQITIDNDFAVVVGPSYGYTFRGKTGDFTTDTMTIVNPNTANLNGGMPEVGDLIIWGEVDKITFECIVKAIIPNNDLTAQLVLVEKNNAIFTAEETQDIAGFDPNISSVGDEDLTAPAAIENLTVVENSFDCNGSQYLYIVKLEWEIPLGTIYEIFEVYVDFGQGYILDSFTNIPSYTYEVDQSNLGLEHNFKVLAVSSTGAKIVLADAISASATPVSKTSPPSNVTDLFINITNETLGLDWGVVEDCDIQNYSIRFSPNLSATWESSIPLVVVNSDTSGASVQARTGAYFIKAIDFNGNQSVNAASAITSIPDLVNLNIVDETNDFPTFPGTLDKLVDIGSSLIITEEVGGTPPEYFDEGEYFYADILDLGEIYTVRLQSLIDAEGYSEDDIMANWVTLSSITALSTVAVSEWDVETYYRGRDSLAVISSWATLSSVVTMSTGESGAWTVWKKFTIGDFTARYFQFKLKLLSLKDSVSPRVIDATIKSDMPDRIEAFDNQVAPALGLSMSYTPAFKGPGTTPAIQITQDSAQQGDYFTISNKTLAGFDIQFFDKNDVAVSRQFDAFVKGYGRKQTATI